MCVKHVAYILNHSLVIDIRVRNFYVGKNSREIIDMRNNKHLILSRNRCGGSTMEAVEGRMGGALFLKKTYGRL